VSTFWNTLFHLHRWCEQEHSKIQNRPKERMQHSGHESLKSRIFVSVDSFEECDSVLKIGVRTVIQEGGGSEHSQSESLRSSFSTLYFSLLFPSSALSPCNSVLSLFWGFYFTNARTWIVNIACLPACLPDPSGCQAFKTLELQPVKVFMARREKKGRQSYF
jgi:hypothetical protein